jgi:Flp pilus assembly secretin CpaC
MPTRRICTALAIVFAILATTISLTRAADNTIVLEIGTDGMALMLERPFKAVLIGDPEVVDVLTQGDRWAMVQPQGLGATNIVFIDEGNIAIANFRVVVCKIGVKSTSLSGQASCEHVDVDHRT